MLTHRTDTAYWRDHCTRESIPERLAGLMELWRSQPPSRYDLVQTEEIFPSASYQYVLYGMGFKTEPRATSCSRDDFEMAHKYFRENAMLMEKQIHGLPANRELIDDMSQLAG